MNAPLSMRGGTHIKGLVSEQNDSRTFESGPALDPARMALGVKKIAADLR
jgi:hypothetical protein